VCDLFLFLQTRDGGLAGPLGLAYADAPLDQLKILNMSVFLFIYVLYMLTVLILMMNLLIVSELEYNKHIFLNKPRLQKY